MSDNWGPAGDQPTHVERRGGGQSNPVVGRVLVLLGIIFMVAGAAWRVSTGETDDPTALDPTAVDRFGWLAALVLGIVLLCVGVVTTNRSRR